MPRFLIVKTSAIGDVIQTMPVVDYLRARYPDCSIDWVVEKGIAPLLLAHPHLERVLFVDTKKWRLAPFSHETRAAFGAFCKELRQVNYDALFDLQGNSKSALITLCAQAKDKVGFSWQSLPEKPNFFVTNRRFSTPEGVNVRARYLALVQSYFGDALPFSDTSVRLTLNDREEERLKALMHKAELASRPRLMVAFGSKWKNKQLSDETLLELLKQIDAKIQPAFLFIYGSEEEKRCAEWLRSHFSDHSLAVGELTLPLWQGLMFQMEGVLAMDSAALHLCGTTSTPSFSFFGPSAALLYKPLGAQHQFVQGSCPYGKVFVKRCPILRSCETGACLRALPVGQLLEPFLSWWETRCGAEAASCR
jgi:heptosyltransferase I